MSEVVEGCDALVLDSTNNGEEEFEGIVEEGEEGEQSSEMAVNVPPPTTTETTPPPPQQQPPPSSAMSMNEAIEKLVPMRSDAFLSRVRSDDPAVAELLLRSSYVTGTTLNMVGDALLTNRRVLRLDLSSNNLADADLVHLINVGLRGNKGVCQINLADNPDVTDATFELITKVLLEDNNTLTHVDATGTGVTQNAWRHFNRLSALNSYPVELKRQLYAAGQDDPDLFAIRLRYDPSDPKVYNAASTRALSMVLGAQRKVINDKDEGINASSSQTPIGSPRRNVLGVIEGAEPAYDPPVNTVVRHLYLGGCCRGEVCVRELLPIIATNPKITSVHLEDNYLGDEAVDMLCGAILKAGPKSHLETLVLDRNEITNNGAKKIIAMLRVNTTIRSVSLLHNPQLTSSTLKEQLRIEMALNCEPSSMRPAIDKIRLGLPENLSDVAEKDLYLRQRVGEMLNPEGILDLCGTPDNDGKGPAKGYFTSLGATTIALALRSNISIHTINFRNNHIGPQGAKALADLLEFNPTIVRIDLSENPITDEGARYLLNAFATNDALVSLYLDDAEVSQRLCDEVKAACHLNSQPEPIKEALRTRDYEFVGHVGSAADSQLADPGSILLNLARRSIQVRGKWKSLHPESAQYIITILKKQPQITHLDLSDNDSFGDEGVVVLKEWLVHPKCSLRKVNLSNTGISDVSIGLLTRSLRANYSLLNIVVAANPNTTTRPRQTLDEAVTLNRFPTKVKDLLPILGGNVMGVTKVDFSRETDAFYKERNLPIPDPLGDDTAKLLFTALVRNTHVTTVRLCNQGIGNRGVGYLVECLSVNESITTVDLSHNVVGSDGASELAVLLDRNASVRSIDLSYNSISEDGAAALLFTMNTANRTVTYLNLAGCSCVSATTRHRIECLAAFNTQSIPFRRHILERISSMAHLRCNGHPDSAHFVGGVVDDDAVGALAMALSAQPHKVQSIDLTNNVVTDVGCRTILQLVLPNHPSITHIDLSNNPLSDEVGGEINAYLQENRHIVGFKVGNAVIDVAKMQRVNPRDMYQDSSKRREGVNEATYSAVSSRCLMSPSMVSRITVTAALNRSPLPFQRAYTQLEAKLVQWHNLKEQLLNKVRREEEVHSPADVKHRLREQHRRESQHRQQLTESTSAFIESEASLSAVAAPTRKSELLTTINKVVPAAVNFSRTEMTGVELRLLCDLLEHFDVFGSKTLRGLQLSDNPGLDDSAIRALVVEHLLPHSVDSLQALHLDRTGLADTSSLVSSTTHGGSSAPPPTNPALLQLSTQTSVMEAIAKLASSSQTLVSLSYTGTPLARVLKSHAKGSGDLLEDSSDDYSNPHALAIVADELAKYDTNALDYAQQLQNVILKALDRNRGRLVGSATDEFFAERTSMSHPYGRNRRSTGGMALPGLGTDAAADIRGRNTLSTDMTDPAAPLLPATPSDLRDEADAILADAMRGAPARTPYTRGKYAPPSR